MDIIKLAKALDVDTEIPKEHIKMLREQGMGIETAKDVILEERILERIEKLNYLVNALYGIFPKNADWRLNDRF